MAISPISGSLYCILYINKNVLVPAPPQLARRTHKKKRERQGEKREERKAPTHAPASLPFAQHSSHITRLPLTSGTFDTVTHSQQHRQYLLSYHHKNTPANGLDPTNRTRLRMTCYAATPRLFLSSRRDGGDDDDDDEDDSAMQPQETPSMEGALPIGDAGSALEQASMPRPRARERYYRNRSSLAMEVLSRRMSRQTLLQQHQSRPTSGDSAALDGSLDDMTTEMEMEMEMDSSSSMPVPPWAQRVRPSRRFLSLSLPHVAPIAPEATIDEDVASRVLARMQADARPAISPARPSRSSHLVPAIEIDAAERADEADEGYSEGPEEYPWLGEKLAGSLKSQGLLSFTTSAEAALRCPKLVRNMPRMRKRSHKKKEHRLRTSREPKGETMAAIEEEKAARLHVP